ncbi:alpha-(1,3)-fucosyltransferase 7-like isoform X2 [Polistes fuscatus]|uniref:alpha-(1,3)-fucosyltransferase 7-like isoform X2 n=1 Tax=Polistes fuscatus TaxID=30207 RepID=UPI001CA9C041|nr:alpha-(1,3)-fucosyltransferase 7-like isoform X2 [Polistes fuscatus]
MFYNIDFVMLLIFRNYRRISIYLCIIVLIIYVNKIIQRYINERSVKEMLSLDDATRNLMVPKELTITNRKTKFVEQEFTNVSRLGQWLLASKKFLPLIIHKKSKPYIILIWKYGPFLERRHIRRFTNIKFSPWENCSVDNCLLSYNSEDLNTVDAVVFHLHFTKSVKNLPIRTRSNQRWIFLTDESPMHTFYYKNQKLSDYNGLFNWSMSYRMDSDIPVPYGRTIPISSTRNSFNNLTYLYHYFLSSKTKLVAIMASNCSGKNKRWIYIRSLKSILGNDLDIYGRCKGGNRTACPGHFDTDCPALNAYKFYLAFENSNCKEYLTEKVFWNGYNKFAVPIIMGAPKSDCERLLPSGSYLHVNDFASSYELAHYLQNFHHNINNYLQFHVWRQHFQVLNEHGYFGSVSRHYCRICEALHYNSRANKVYEDLDYFWGKEKFCSYD